MNKKTIKIIAILTIVLTIITLSTVVMAGETVAGGTGGVDVNNLTGTATNKAGDISKFGNSVIGVLQAVGVVLSVVILIVLGIKYMVGSAEEKAEYKKTMMPYVIGAILIFAASTLAGIVIGFSTGAGA